MCGLTSSFCKDTGRFDVTKFSSNVSELYQGTPWLYLQHYYVPQKKFYHLFLTIIIRMKSIKKVLCDYLLSRYCIQANKNSQVKSICQFLSWQDNFLKFKFSKENVCKRQFCPKTKRSWQWQWLVYLKPVKTGCVSGFIWFIWCASRVPAILNEDAWNSNTHRCNRFSRATKAKLIYLALVPITGEETFLEECPLMKWKFKMIHCFI